MRLDLPAYTQLHLVAASLLGVFSVRYSGLFGAMDSLSAGRSLSWADVFAAGLGQCIVVATFGIFSGPTSSAFSD